MKFWMLGLILALFAPAAFSQTPPQTRKQTKKPDPVERDPVFQLSDELVFEGRVVRGSIRKSEIDSLLARRVTLGGMNLEDEFGKYGLGFIYEDGRFPVFSCQEYASARSQGFSGQSTFERSIESFFISACGFLYALRDARLAKRSFIANPRVGLSNLNLLPVNVMSPLAIGDEEDLLNKQAARGVRISNLVAKREVKVTPYEFGLTLIYEGSRTVLNEMGRADFNGDGIEDIYVFSAEYAEPGTGRYYDSFLLTRRGPSAGFEIKKLDLPAFRQSPSASATGIKLRSSQLTKTRITKKEIGDGWPFEVNEGELACARAGSVAVFFIANGKTYALNVWARGSKIDGKAVLQNASFDLINGPNLGAVFDKGFAMCQEK